jgi:hypothetical protein
MTEGRPHLLHNSVEYRQIPEKAASFLCRTFLGFATRAPRKMVYGKLRRYHGSVGRALSSLRAVPKLPR